MHTIGKLEMCRFQKANEKNMHSGKFPEKFTFCEFLKQIRIFWGTCNILKWKILLPSKSAWRADLKTALRIGLTSLLRELEAKQEIQSFILGEWESLQLPKKWLFLNNSSNIGLNGQTKTYFSSEFYEESDGGLHFPVK